MGAMTPELPSLEGMTVRLNVLLDRARDIKPDTTVEPLLPAVEFSGEKGLPTTRPGSGLHNSLVETAARRIFQATAAATDIRDPAFVKVWNLFDILSICGDQGQCDTSLVWLLIEELLDVQSIEGCKAAFDYLDSRRERLTSKNFKAKNLVILRTCNDLLRRLSRAEDTVFCGRVYIFLFQSFPLGDKSSVNLRGEFHTENITTFEDGPPKVSDRDAESADADESSNDVAMAEADASAPADCVTIKVSSEDAKPDEAAKTNDIDQDGVTDTSIDELYPVFWSLQKAFSNPPTVFAPQFLREFKSGLESTLSMFKRVPRVIQAAATQEKRGTKRKAGEAVDDFANTFNPKYLTSRELFKLELSDLAFQRHILVQALILLDFLLSLTEKSKERLAHLNTQKALQYPFTLSEEDGKWANEIRDSIKDHLQAGESGKFYYRMVETVLSRDKNWVRWKMENCPPIAKPPISADDYLSARKEARSVWANKRLRPVPMGSLNLKFLSEAEKLTTLDELKRSSRYTLPSAESLLKGIENDNLDLEMANGEEERTQLEEAKQNKTWRLLRTVSKTKLGMFNLVDDIQKLDALFKQEDGVEKDELEDAKAEMEGVSSVKVAGDPTKIEDGLSQEQPLKSDDSAEAAAAS